MKKGIYECIKLDRYGYGMILDLGKNYQVKNILPGEKAEITIFTNGFGKVEKWIKQTPTRVKAKCPKFNECGGCQVQHILYEEQLQMKTNLVKEFLNQYSLEQVLCLPCLGMKDPYFYRNKSQMVISEKGKKTMSGFYEENTHSIVNIDKCYIQDPLANEIIKTCRILMDTQKIKAYQEDRKIGLIRHILVRRSQSTNQVLVTIVTSQEMFPGRNNFVKALREKHPEITSIVQNVNSRQTSIVLGDFERVLYGTGVIQDELLGKTFLVSSKTFYQVNSKQTELLYKKALELAKPKKTDIMLDAYCGVGTIGIYFSDYVKKVYGVELNKESVKQAIQNAKFNQARNIRFYQNDVLDFMNKKKEELEHINIVLVDPPRSGLEEEFIQSVIEIKPEKVVYISCDPETLARDLKVFEKNGYHISQVQPIDIFPQTSHIESVTLLSLK